MMGRGEVGVRWGVSRRVAGRWLALVKRWGICGGEEGWCIPF